jgi:hypothetical protein
VSGDPKVDHPADVKDPDNKLGLADQVEIAAGNGNPLDKK